MKQKKFKIILLSNGHKRNILPVLKRYHAIGFFDKIMISHDLGYQKSELVPFKQILKDFKFKPSEVIMVGDRLDEDMHAKKLGIHTVRIKREVVHLTGEPIQPDYEIKDLLELIPIIGKIERKT